MEINRDIRYNAFPSEITAILKKYLPKKVFEDFETQFNIFVSAKNNEINNLKTELKNNNSKADLNQKEINTLNKIKADKTEALLKNNDGNYVASNMIKSNKYSFFEDETTYFAKIDNKSIGIFIKNKLILKVNIDGDIILPTFSSNNGEILVFSQDGTITTNGIKLRVYEDVLQFYNGFLWVTIL